MNVSLQVYISRSLVSRPPLSRRPLKGALFYEARLTTDLWVYTKRADIDWFMPPPSETTKKTYFIIHVKDTPGEILDLTGMIAERHLPADVVLIQRELPTATVVDQLQSQVLAQFVSTIFYDGGSRSTTNCPLGLQQKPIWFHSARIGHYKHT